MVDALAYCIRSAISLRRNTDRRRRRSRRRRRRRRRRRQSQRAKHGCNDAASRS
jgi:hypothetical protein